jgi:glycosyltransferase involved in cell wall biosynthesis
VKTGLVDGPAALCAVLCRLQPMKVVTSGLVAGLCDVLVSLSKGISSGIDMTSSGLQSVVTALHFHGVLEGKGAVVVCQRQGALAALVDVLNPGLLSAIDTFDHIGGIGNNTTGINEVISHGVNGFLSPEPDHNSLTMTLSLAINSDHNKISTSAINFIKDNYSLESIAEKERQIFYSLFKH